MIDDMKLAGLSAKTQEVYLQAVTTLVKHYRNRSPDQISGTNNAALSARRSAQRRAAHPRTNSRTPRFAERGRQAATSLDGDPVPIALQR
jgi:hypothetical protein